MSNSIPQIIANFIQQHHVVSLACCTEEQLWTASCFYAFDEINSRLIILTDRNTQHGKLMQENPNIVGTIAAQPNEIQEIEGIQFKATAKLLSKEAQFSAFSNYCKRHKYAEKMQSDVWEIQLRYIKHTSNRVIFAQKTEWTS